VCNRRPIATTFLATAWLAGGALSGTAIASQPLVARLAVDNPVNGIIKSMKSAVVRVSTTNAKGANGLVMSVKVTGAMDSSGLLANTSVVVEVQLTPVRSQCSFDTIFDAPVAIVNGTGKAKIVAQGHGDIREVFTPTFLLLCSGPQMFSGDFHTAIASVHLFDPAPGTILSAPFRLAPTVSPITSWKKGKILVKSVSGGDIQATTTISGAKEGTVPSTRTIIPLMPAFDGVSVCSSTPYFVDSIFLTKGNGKSTIDHLELGGSDPGAAGCMPDHVGLEDGSLNTISDGIGVVQGIDPD
jgi:hypothetical protein